MKKSNSEKIWCVVPAAGIGSRMDTDRPKQYLPLRSSTVLDTTIQRLLSSKKIHLVVVCLHPNDTEWKQSAFSNNKNVVVTTGGDERADSVISGINAVKTLSNDDDWVLVHDAARPCIRADDVDALIDTALESQKGAILATPMHDTVKKVKDNLAEKTLDRSTLWRALTPQLFKLKELEMALLNAKTNDLMVTDEASAIEQIMKPVQIVEGRVDNIKITTRSDLVLASFYLDQQENEICE
jgi:2-C-methyl-D-erythritol 4-phosphate cytidylyltransferase